MARGVDDIDLNAVILNGGILCENCDSSFTLDVVGIHYSVFNFLIFSECAALLEHFINEGGLAVVNVGDDGDVAQIVSYHNNLSFRYVRFEFLFLISCKLNILCNNFKILRTK